MLSLTLKLNLLPILMRLTSVVLISWISSITSKISWIVSWPWSNHVCVCVCECASMSVCNWFYNLIHGPQKQILVFFWSGNLDFGLEKSWKYHATFFWDFNRNPEGTHECLNFIMWPSDAIRQQRFGSTLVWILAWCQQAPSHNRNQCWLVISEV